MRAPFVAPAPKKCPVECIDVRLRPARARTARARSATSPARSPSTSAAASPVATASRPASSTPSSRPSSTRSIAAGSRSSPRKPPKLTSGHGLCSGCGAGLVVNQVLAQVESHYVVSGATGCLEVSTTRLPVHRLEGQLHPHQLRERGRHAHRRRDRVPRPVQRRASSRTKVKFIAFGGDGGTYDIGLQALSGAMERGHHMLYVCYDNGAYMNTGFQRSERDAARRQDHHQPASAR